MKRREPGSDRIYKMTHAPDQGDVLYGVNRELSYQRGSSNIESVFVDPACRKGEIILGPCLTAVGPLVENEAMVHPDTAVELASSVTPDLRIKEQLTMPDIENDTEAFVVEHGRYLQTYPGQACLLDISRTLPANPYGNEAVRAITLRQMNAQLVEDAFKRGLGIIGLSDVAYRVVRYLGLRNAQPAPDAYLSPEWTTEAPPARLLERDASVEMMIKAVGFPIRVRET